MLTQIPFGDCYCGWATPNTSCLLWDLKHVNRTYFGLFGAPGFRSNRNSPARLVLRQYFDFSCLQAVCCAVCQRPFNASTRQAASCGWPPQDYKNYLVVAPRPFEPGGFHAPMRSEHLRTNSAICVAILSSAASISASVMYPPAGLRRCAESSGYGLASAAGLRRPPWPARQLHSMAVSINWGSFLWVSLNSSPTILGSTFLGPGLLVTPISKQRLEALLISPSAAAVDFRRKKSKQTVPIRTQRL